MNFGIGHVCSATQHDQLKQDGKINVSPYDTAWVALVKDLNGNNAPLFPSCLQWIADHQHEDGSWGDSSFFGARDRMINTLACVVALKSWNAYHDKVERGISLLKGGMHKLGDEHEETFLVGFEVAFPSLLNMAEKLDIRVVEDSTLLEETYAKRNLKLSKIPKEILHTVPTKLLHSLEGVMTTGLDWNRLLQLRIKDGMPLISNNKYLDLAKLEFKRCQAQHQLEWKTIQKWYTDSDFGGLGISIEELLSAYFLAAASIFEPEKSNERMAWTETAVLIKIIESYFNNEATSSNDRTTFINELRDSTAKDRLKERNDTSERFVDTLLKTINQLSVVADGRDIHQQLYRAWEKWIKTLHEEGCGYLGEAELILQTVCCSGVSRSNSDKPLTSADQHLIQVTNIVCNNLRHFQNQKCEKHVDGRYISGSEEPMITDPQIEDGMRELVQLVFQNSPDSKDDADTKQTCLMIAKTFYYTAYCNAKTIDSHITKVLFDRLD